MVEQRLPVETLQRRSSQSASPIGRGPSGLERGGMSAGQQAQSMRRAPRSRPSTCAGPSTAKREVVGFRLLSPQVGLAQLVERVVGAAGQVFGVDGETEVFVPGLTGLALGAPALGLQQLADVLELAAHVAGKVLVGGHDVRRVVGVGDHKVAQALEGGRDVGLHEVGEEVDIDPAARVDRDGERVRRVADVLGRGRLGGDEALLRISALSVTLPSESTFSRLRRLSASEWSVNPLRGTRRDSSWS